MIIYEPLSPNSDLYNLNDRLLRQALDVLPSEISDLHKEKIVEYFGYLKARIAPKLYTQTLEAFASNDDKKIAEAYEKLKAELGEADFDEFFRELNTAPVEPIPSKIPLGPGFSKKQ